MLSNCSWCFSFILILFFNANSLFNLKAQTPSPIKLVLAAGHGGKDPGKPKGSSKLLDEKDINLIITLKLGQYIEENLPHVQVIYTRKTDIFVPLDDVVDIANLNNADYLISIHCNSNPIRRVYGTRTHFQNHIFKTSKNLALQIEKEFGTRAARRSRGVMASEDRGMNLQVLQYTEMPGVLIEAGFMTNPKEEKYLNSDYGQSIIASAIYRAFRDFVSTPQPKEDRSTFYKIQVMSSSKKENIYVSRYNKLDMRVEEYLDTKNEKYPYRYLVGREYDFKLAKKLLKKVQNLGFKDAFLINMKKNKQLKFQRHSRQNRQTP